MYPSAIGLSRDSAGFEQQLSTVMSEQKVAAPPNPAARREGKGMGPWRGNKPAGFILHPELFMRECIGMDVSIRVMNGAKWRGVLREVRENGDVLIRPAQELLYDEPDGPGLPEKLLVKGDILWLRRLVKDSDNAGAMNQPQDEPLEAPSPAKSSQQP